MNTPNKTEFDECLKIVGDMMRHLECKKWNIDPRINFAKRNVASARLASIEVRLSAFDGCYSNVTLIKGNDAIVIQLPNKEVVPPRITTKEKNDIRRVLFGVIIHEYTHVIQRLNAPATYKSTMKLLKQFHSINAPSADECFDLYLGQPFEQEARASQAAAEIIELADGSLTQSQFQPKLSDTEVWDRTERMIRGPTNPAQKIKSWWSIWSAMA